MLCYSLLRASHNHGHLWWTKCANWLLAAHLLTAWLLHLILLVELVGFCTLWLCLQDVSFRLPISCRTHEFLVSPVSVSKRSNGAMVSCNRRKWMHCLGLTLIFTHKLDKFERRKSQLQSFFLSSLKVCRLQSMFLIWT